MHNWQSTLIALLITIPIFAGLIWLTKLIAESDLPLWLKIILLR